jgi:transcriptional regulator with XRE-family HTH domain
LYSIKNQRFTQAYFCEVRYYLKEYRTIQGLSQRELVGRSTVALSTILKIETEPGKERQPKVIGKLARALGINPDDLQKHPSESVPAQPEVKEFRARTMGYVSREELAKVHAELSETVAELKLIRRAKELKKILEQAGENPNIDIDL